MTTLLHEGGQAVEHADEADEARRKMSKLAP